MKHLHYLFKFKRYLSTAPRIPNPVPHTLLLLLFFFGGGSVAWGQQVIVRNTAYPGLNTWFSPPSSAPNPADCSTLALTTPNNASYFPDVELKVDAISGLNVTISVKRADGQVLSMDDLYFNVRSGNSWESGLCNDPTNPWVNIDDNHFATGNNVLERTINFDVPSSHPVGTPIIYWVALQQSLPTATSPHSHSYFPLILERVAPCSANITAPSGSTYTTTDAAITLAGSPSGGSFTVNGSSATSFDPAALGAGSHTIVYDMGGGCTDSKTVTVTASGPPPSSCAAPTGLTDVVNCSGSTMQFTWNAVSGASDYTLGLRTAGSSSWTTGTISGTASGTSALPANGTTIEARIRANCGGTSSSWSSIHSFTISCSTPPPSSCSITAPSGSSYTTADAAITLAGTPAGGTFTVNGSSATSFDPAALGVGSHTVEYTEGSCTDTKTITVTAPAPPPCSASITAPSSSSFTTSDAPVTLAATPAGGTFTINGASATTFDPGALGTGSYTIEYDDGTGCTTTHTVNVATPPCIQIGDCFVCGDNYNTVSAGVTEVSGNVRIYNVSHGGGANPPGAIHYDAMVTVDDNALTISGAGSALYIRNIPHGPSNSPTTFELWNGSFTVGVSGNSLLVNTPNSITNLFSLVGLTVFLEDIEVRDTGVLLNGQLGIPEIWNWDGLKEGITGISLDVNTGLGYSGQVCAPDLEIVPFGGPELMTVKNACLAYNTTIDPHEFHGSLGVKTELFGTIEGSCVVLKPAIPANAPGQLNQVNIAWTPSQPKPLGMGVSLARIEGEVKNFSDYVSESMSLGLVNTQFVSNDGYLVGLDINRAIYTLGSDFRANARGSFVQESLATLDLVVNKNRASLTSEATIMAGMFQGDLRFGMNYRNGFSASGSLKGGFYTPNRSTLQNLGAPDWLVNSIYLTVGSNYHLADMLLVASYQNPRVEFAGIMHISDAALLDLPDVVSGYFSWNNVNNLSFNALRAQIGRNFDVVETKPICWSIAPAANNTNSTVPVAGLQCGLSVASTINLERLLNLSLYLNGSKEYKAFEIKGGTRNLFISAQGTSGVPNFSILAPDGSIIDAASAVTPLRVFHQVPSDNRSYYKLTLPQMGYYMVEYDNPSTQIEVIRLNEVPEVEITDVQNDPASRTLTYNWRDADADDDAQISLGLDTDTEGLNGRYVVENISEDDLADSYALDYSNLPTGHYYPFAVIEDTSAQITHSYSTERVKLVNANAPAPPTNLTQVVSDTAVRFTWTPSTSTVPLRYNLYYSDEPGTVSYNSPSVGVPDTTFFDDVSFIRPGSYYEVFLVAVDTFGQESDHSNIVSFTFNSTTLNNRPVLPTHHKRYRVMEGGTFNEPFGATDADGDPLTYSLSYEPTGVNVSATGDVSWPTSGADVGTHFMRLKVCDNQGACDSTSFFVVVQDSTSAVARMRLSKSAYVGYGEDAFVYVNDEDFAGNPDRVDSVQVQLTSESDLTGISIYLKETGFNTNTFKGIFDLNSLASASGTLLVNPLDTIYAEYQDPSISASVQTIAAFIDFDISFLTDESVICNGDSVQFVNTSRTSFAYLSWDFGNGQTSTKRHPKVPFYAFAAGDTTYNVTLTMWDDEGNTQSVTHPIRVSNPTIEYVKQDVTCYGFNDGFIDVTMNGGIQPYTYLWNTGHIGPDLTNLGPGVYGLRVTDSIGCTDSVTVQILEPDSLYAIMHVRPVRCHGDNDGALNAATFGGSGVYTWEWYKDGVLFDTTEDLDSITSGVYTLILQDSEGCIFTDSWLVPEPDVMEITGTVKHSSCAGADNGMIEPVITGGAPPYTFLWNTGQTTRIIPNLAPTNLEPYEIMVKDTNNCVVYMQFTVNEPTGTPALTYDKVIYCVNEPNPTPTLENVWNGQFVATGTGLDIDPSTGEINLSNSSLGTYTVNYMSDIAMCNTASFEVTIKAEESPAFTFPTRFCKQNGGTFTPQIQGTPDGRFSGTALPDSLTGEVAIDSLAPGLYTLIYTTPDCHEVKTLEIEIYDEPMVNIFQSDTVVCEGTAINLQAEASVGTYRWEINGQVMGDQQTLSHSFDTPGTYRVKLTSETGDGFCTKTEQIAVRVSEYPTVDLGADIFSCEGPVTLDAGNAGMGYLWSDGSTSQTLTVTESGTFSVIVTNADGCATTSAEINVTITKPQIAVFKENISCLGQQDGRIQIEVTEGTPPYKIRWNDLATDSVLSREHLPAATYVVTVEDSKGCITTAEVEIVEPEAIIATAEIRKPTCFEAGNGFIILDIQGGTIAPGSDYIVNWSNGMTGKRIDGLSNGIYEAEISDDNGCLGYWRGTIDEVDSMRIELVLTNASCEGATDGSAVFNISGGQPPYTVTYSKPEFNGLANHNLAPTADVPVHAWVEDASGHCRQEFTFEIGVAPTSILDFSIQDTAVCVGETTQLNFRYTGEIYPYNIVLEDNGQEVQFTGTDSTFTHEVTITEDREFVLKAVRYGSGCEGIASGEAKVTAKPLPELANPLISHANCGNEDGQIAIDTEEIEAGTAPFEFSLDGENFTTDSLFTDLEPGEYTLYIREADGCVFVFPAPILIQDKPCSVKDIPTLITPNGDGKNDAWIVDDLRAYPQCVVRIYTREGLLIHESEPGYTTPWEANGHPFGTYFYTIDLRNGEIVKGFISVVR